MRERPICDACDACRQPTRRGVLRAGLALAPLFATGCVNFHDADVLPVPDQGAPVAFQAGLPAGTVLLPVDGDTVPLPDGRETVPPPGGEETVPPPGGEGVRRMTVFCVPAARPAGVVVAFGGNGNSARTMLRVLAPRAAAASLTLIVPSYYVAGEAPPSGPELRALADASFRAASGMGVPVYLLGHSLGCFVAIDLASRRAIRGLALAAVGTTVAETFGQQYFPLDLVLRYRADPDVAIFDAVTAARSVRASTLIVSSTADDTIPVHLSRRVYDALPAHTPKQFLVLDGVGHGAYLSSPAFWAATAPVFAS